MRLLAALAFALAMSHPSAATTLAPNVPLQVSLDGRDCLIFFVPTQAGYEVSATFAANAPDDGRSMRAVFVLLPGQRGVLSADRVGGGKPAELVIRRDGDRLEIIPPDTETAQIPHRF